VLGKELLSALIGRIASMRREDQRADFAENRRNSCVHQPTKHRQR
jgi:hypothetical protein